MNALEEGALAGIFHMALERQRPFGLGQLEDRVKQAQQLEIRVLVVALGFEQPDSLRHRGGQDRLAVGGNEGADGGAGNDQHLERLEQYAEMPTIEQVP